MKKEYSTVYYQETDIINDDLTKILNTWAEDSYTLHSMVPYVIEGSTKGYTLIFELMINEG